MSPMSGRVRDRLARDPAEMLPDLRGRFRNKPHVDNHRDVKAMTQLDGDCLERHFN